MVNEFGLIKHMIKYFSIIIMILSASCQVNKSIIKDNVSIKIYQYEYQNEIRASAMPELKAGSQLKLYKRRLEYLLLNISEIHLQNKTEERNEIFKLYPDTSKIKRLYLKKYTQDKKLAKYFEETIAPIVNPNLKISKVYTMGELMEVASKFFYCDKVAPDTSVQAHVCIGLNGVKEANWEKDYTLLEAFCYEGIFNEFDNESSPLWDSFVFEKSIACQKYRASISTLDKYLEDVKLNLFERMMNNEILKKSLLAYYELNKNNLAFRIVN